MLLEDLLTNLALQVEPFAVCSVSDRWRLKMPPLEWLTLHYVLRGEGRLHLGGTVTYPLAEGSLALVPQRRAHALEAGEHSEHHVTTDDRAPDEHGLLRFEAGDSDDLVVACGRTAVRYGTSTIGLFDALHDPIVLDFSGSDVMRRTFTRLLEESTGTSPGSGAMLTALMNECLVTIFRELCAAPECELPWLLAVEDPRMQPVIDAVLHEPAAPHSLESLAERAGMSRSVFARSFSERFGQTPMAFVRGVRLREAAELLQRTDLTVGTIAHRVGYASRSQFSRAFDGEFDRSPSAFREDGPRS